MVQAPSVNRLGEVIMSVSIARKSKKWSKKDFLNRVMSGRLSSERALAKLTEQLHQYERKYNMRSEIFYQLIVGTPAEDHPDFIAWAICYRSYFRALKAKVSLEGVLPGAL
jgi:hypothetical protein